MLVLSCCAGAGAVGVYDIVEQFGVRVPVCLAVTQPETLVITHNFAHGDFLFLALKGPWKLAGGGGAAATTGKQRWQIRALAGAQDARKSQ